ncbi:aldehyde dehydrogenase family protein [Brevibacterium casei]|uniref:Aldehyde dehydrogenase (NAD+) n=2 Tax=Brevibacterium casei TaxID=33889 RepID=A0A2H1JE54_9MICO|nr:aldehyde dehydrogenase family protein [Brevibacterium casei]MCT1552176.1 aldehyde dehydrogenase family protein [Brevibacterium casei]MCT1559399.1 aldehyde dehydrogenase family protein [Brevibacterium casei]MCT2207386.1 aldehyde dehydrogenase family protein [Brevibacterium casei]PAK97259.1 aldehyde dehydrogenase PuuC [Brevibacterium casei]QPR39036.1 aldehyde dehydrogenase family protein [Brevibacterium casei]
MTDTLTRTPAAEEWRTKAAALTLDGRPVIDGARVDAQSGQTHAKTNPATGEVISTLHLGDGADVDRAVASARRAYDDGAWSRASATDRREVLLRLADLIEARADEFALLDTLDMGKPIGESSTIDAPGAAALFRFYGEAIEKVTDEIPATPSGSTALVTREPLGVIGVIVPWNYPLEIATWKIAPALAAGNSLVVKPPVEASHSTLLLAELAVEAGLPAGVLNVVPGRGSVVGTALGRHMDVDMLAFTGSTAVAKQLQIYAGESNMKRLALEAGGKSANVIFAETDDLEAAAQKAAFGAFYNQGEVCSATSRIFVERPVYDEFVRLLTRAAESFQPGDPLDPDTAIGSLVSEKHAEEVWECVEQARADGTIVAGGERPAINGMSTFITPTVVTGLPADHRLHEHEIFGPVALVTPFDSEDEAIAKANETPYGLAAALWTGSMARAHRVASRLVAGTVSVNTVDALGFTTPFGGFKQSGFGRDLSIHALENYTDLKTTWLQWG